LAILIMAGCSLAALAASAHGEIFHENLQFQVLVGDSIIPHAHVYDSDDFQEILLVPEEGSLLLLELGTESVYELAAGDLEQSGEEWVLRDDHDGNLVAALSKEEGSIVVDLEETSYRLSPMPPLVGIISREKLVAVKPSYALTAEAYEPDAEILSKLKTLDRSINASVYFGTWCRMCKHLVPKFMGTVDAMGNPNLQVRYVGVSESRDEPAKWLVRYGVEKTPSILFFEGGKEIGRIEETAEPSVEAVMAEIFFGS
jgi:hypothetical protein